MVAAHKPSMPKYRFWTAEERELVRVRYDGRGQTTEHLALQLGRAPGAIHQMAMRLGVLGVGGAHRPWTEQEIEWLKANFDRLPSASLAQRLQRSVNSVSIKLHRLRLSRRYRNGWFTETEVSEILGVGRLWVLRRRESGELKARLHHGDTPPWHIEEADLKRFIRAHVSELTGRNVDLGMIVDLFDSSLRSATSWETG